MSDDSGATRDALKRAARYIASFLRHASPSEKDALAWTIESRGNVVHLRNRELGAWATALNKRHMVYGNRSGPWFATNDKVPSRSDWDARALEAAADRATQMFGDDWVRQVASHSDLWELG